MATNNNSTSKKNTSSTKKPASTKTTSSKTTTSKTSTSKTSSNKKTASNGKTYWGKNYYKNPDLQTETKKAANASLTTAITNSVSNSGLSASQSNAVNKEIKKLPLISKICIVLLFLIGVAISIGTCFYICRNDQFEIVGQKTMTIAVGETYVDRGVSVICFGKDMTSTATIEVYKNGSTTKLANGLDDIDTNEESSYQIVYNVNNFRFRNITIIRILLVTETQDDPTVDDHDDLEEPGGTESFADLIFYNQHIA